MSKVVRHIIQPGGGNEHSFCGLAFDAFDTGDADEPSVFEYGRPGLRVTCSECCEAIKNIRETLRGVRLFPEKS